MLYFDVKQVVRKDNVHKRYLCVQRSSKNSHKCMDKGVESCVEAGWKQGGSKVSRVEAYKIYLRKRGTFSILGRPNFPLL